MGRNVRLVVFFILPFEDRLVFPWWKELDLREVKSAIKEAEAIIDSFGRENYIELIGLSPESFVYMFE